MRVQFLLKNTGMFERLGIMTLSSTLKNKGHEVRLTLTEGSREEEILENVKIYKPKTSFSKPIKVFVIPDAHDSPSKKKDRFYNFTY